MITYLHIEVYKSGVAYSKPYVSIKRLTISMYWVSAVGLSIPGTEETRVSHISDTDTSVILPDAVL